jgi:hypothetical protein
MFRFTVRPNRTRSISIMWSRFRTCTVPHTNTVGNQLWLTKLLTSVICAERKSLASGKKTCKVETGGVITSSNYTPFLRIKIKFAIPITSSSTVREAPLYVGSGYFRLHCGELNCEMVNNNGKIILSYIKNILPQFPSLILLFLPENNYSF